MAELPYTATVLIKGYFPEQKWSSVLFNILFAFSGLQEAAKLATAAKAPESGEIGFPVLVNVKGEVSLRITKGAPEAPEINVLSALETTPPVADMLKRAVQSD